MEGKNRLVIIDGNAVMHRAYHALPPLTSPDGQVVNAVYGFLTMMFKVISDLSPSHLAVCFDVGKPTFRQKEHPEYWANRPKPDADYISQMEIIHVVLGNMGIATFEKEGFEADDVIGTVALQATVPKLKTQNSKLKTKSKKLKTERDEEILKQVQDDTGEEFGVVIVTGDRDLLQLVNDRVKVYMPVKGLTEATLFDEKLVTEKYGVKPSQWVDYKALRGDVSDNYSGVVGIGPKTAEELIKTYGSLEGVYKNLKKVPERVSGRLRDGEKMAELSKHLAQIVTDVPVEVDLERTKLLPFGREEVVSEFEKWGFKSLVKKVSEGKKSTLEIIREERVKAEEKEDKGSGQMGLF